jgi:hypothetical protein
VNTHPRWTYLLTLDGLEHFWKPWVLPSLSSRRAVRELWNGGTPVCAQSGPKTAAACTGSRELLVPIGYRSAACSAAQMARAVAWLMAVIASLFASQAFLQVALLLSWRRPTGYLTAYLYAAQKRLRPRAVQDSVHNLGSGGYHWTQLVPVDQFGRCRAIVTSQARDLFHGYPAS